MILAVEDTRMSTNPLLSPDGDGTQGPSPVFAAYGLPLRPSLLGEQRRRSIKCRHQRSDPFVMTLFGTS